MSLNPWREVIVPHPDVLNGTLAREPRFGIRGLDRARVLLGCRWDITAYAPIADGKLPEARHIEVKGRVKGASTVTVTKNEIFESWNQGNKYHLAIVLVGEDDAVEGLHYVPHPFKEEPGWGVASVNYDLKALLERAERI